MTVDNPYITYTYNGSFTDNTISVTDSTSDSGDITYNDVWVNRGYNYTYAAPPPKVDPNLKKENELLKKAIKSLLERYCG